MIPVQNHATPLPSLGVAGVVGRPQSGGLGEPSFLQFRPSSRTALAHLSTFLPCGLCAVPIVAALKQLRRLEPFFLTPTFGGKELFFYLAHLWSHRHGGRGSH